MALFYLGIFLTALGGCITVLFWVPKLVDKAQLRAFLGPRYPLIYFIYLANGPFLLVLGLLLLWRFQPY